MPPRGFLCQSHDWYAPARACLAYTEKKGGRDGRKTVSKLPHDTVVPPCRRSNAAHERLHRKSLLHPGRAPASAAPSAGSAGTADESAGTTSGGNLEGTGFTQDPCTLLTDAEVSQQLGQQVSATPSIDEGLMCEWMPDDQPVLAPVFLEYQREDSRFHLDVIRDLERPKTSPGVQRFDIGNGALLNENQRVISVLVGSATFRIGGEGPLSDDALVDLARLAQSRVRQ